MLNLTKSKEAFNEAKNYIPGGVNSPVRSFKQVDINPPFIQRGKGSKLYDIDGNEYIDYVLSWGPMILGHSHEKVIEKIKETLDCGTSFGAPTELETKLAKLITELMPSMEKVRMVNSGTEATMSAIRLARGFTGREKIVKFIGCYHGHGDSLLVKAGSGAATFGVPDSLGVTKGAAQDTITIPYNDIAAFEEVLKKEGKDIACVIIEPIAGNMGLVLPKQGYLRRLRELCTEYGILLIFDEVMCGFRCSLGGAQGAYGIKPDLTCLGKIIGGGLPVAAYGGRADIMEYVSPVGGVYQAGTLSGNPLGMASGYATLTELAKEPEYKQPDETRKLTLMTKKLIAGIENLAKKYGVPMQIHQAGSMFCFFFTPCEVVDYETATKSDLVAFNIWFKAMLERGIYLPPSQFESLFMSLAHSDEDINKTIEAADFALQKVAEYYKSKGV